MPADIYVEIDMNTYIQVIHTYNHTYIQYIEPYIHAYIHTLIHTFIHTYIHTYRILLASLCIVKSRYIH